VTDPSFILSSEKDTEPVMLIYFFHNFRILKYLNPYKYIKEVRKFY